LLKKTFDINVLSNWYTAKAFILTMASAASFIGVAGIADYTATKAAILSFHEGLAQEIKHHYKAPNVLTTSVHPNWVRTPLIGPVEEDLKKGGSVLLEPEDVANAVVQSILSCRGGQVVLPQDVGKVALLRGLPNWVQETVRDGVSGTILRSAMPKQ
jgi:all-trans-retinol dehydrogenase (NAD+)